MRSLSRLVTALVGTALLASLAAMPALAGFPSTPTTWWVDDDFMGAPGNCDSSSPLPLTIQEAVDTSNPGDTIMVCPGLYYGAISVTKSDLTLRSVQKGMAVLSPASDHVPDTDLVAIQNATGSSLRGFGVQVATTGDCEYVASMIKVFDAPGTIVRGNKIGITGDEGLGACGYVTGIQIGGTSGGSQALHNTVTDFQFHGIYDTSAGTTLIWGNRINYLHKAYAPNSNSADGILANPISGGVVQIHLNTIRSAATAGTSTPKLQTGIVSTGSTLDIKRNIGKNVLTFIYALAGTSGKIKDNKGILNVQRGLDFNQTSGVEITGNRVVATEVGVDVDSLSSGNNFHDNDWDGSAPNDCYDASSGGGTANTANTWTNNYGDTSSPPGICTPAP